MSHNDKITKREFLRKISVLSSILVSQSFGIKDILAETNKQSDLPPMPMVQFGNYKISKLIIGSNPMEGVSHFSKGMTNIMLEYCSDENILKIFELCEENGINTWQSHGTENFMNLLDMHRERGGKLDWIVSSSVQTIEDFPKNLQWLMSRKPIAFYHWGASTDKQWREGKINKVQVLLKMIRDEGVLVGLCSHNHQVLEYAEEKNWDVDFYMACFYNPIKKISENINEYYGEEDRESICKFINTTNKFCFGYKILAASRNASTPENARKAFEYALKNIKKNDAVIVGMFLPYHVIDNTKYVKEIWKEMYPS